MMNWDGTLGRGAKSNVAFALGMSMVGYGTLLFKGFFKLQLSVDACMAQMCNILVLRLYLHILSFCCVWGREAGAT